MRMHRGYRRRQWNSACRVQIPAETVAFTFFPNQTRGCYQGRLVALALNATSLEGNILNSKSARRGIGFVRIYCPRHTTAVTTAVDMVTLSCWSVNGLPTVCLLNVSYNEEFPIQADICFCCSKERWTNAIVQYNSFPAFLFCKWTLLISTVVALSCRFLKISYPTIYRTMFFLWKKK